MRTKADVLDKIAKILDDMSHSPRKLTHGSDETEIVVAIASRSKSSAPSAVFLAIEPMRRF